MASDVTEATSAEMSREYDVRIEAGPDRHGITQGQFLYVFEPGRNRIELLGEPGYLHLEPGAETKTWLMPDIDTGLAIVSGRTGAVGGDATSMVGLRAPPSERPTRPTEPVIAVSGESRMRR